MRSVEMSHANVPGLIFIFKNIIFIWYSLKPTLRSPKSHVRYPSHITTLGQIRESTLNYLGTTIALKFSASAHRATGRLGGPLN
jgi:hypothetical protein